MKYLICLIFSLIFSLNIFSKNLIIGDSNVNVVKYTTGFSNLNLDIGISKRGINTLTLTLMLKKIKISNYDKIFILIGTNDLYNTDNSKKLINVLKEKYPNSLYYVIWGSRGWDNDKYVSINKQQNFYDKFEKNGFNVIKITSGYFSTCKKAHTSNQKYQFEIIKKIKELN